MLLAGKPHLVSVCLVAKRDQYWEPKISHGVQRKTRIISMVWPLACTGWPNRLNKCGRSHMPFYMLITLLFDEARLVQVQVQLVGKSKLKHHQENKCHELQTKILKYWGEYENEASSALKLICACSRLYVSVQ